MITLSIGQLLFGIIALICYVVLVIYMFLTIDDLYYKTKNEKILHYILAIIAVPGIIITIISAMIIAAPFELYYRYFKK